MPKISESFGIVIYLYYREHPPPHFHAVYGEDEALISIEDLSVLEGSLKPRALGLVSSGRRCIRTNSEMRGSGRAHTSRLGRSSRSSRGEAAMLYRIVAAKAQPDYRLWVRFADGKEGEVDLSSLVGKGVFSRWEDPREFEKVYIDEDMGTVAWPGEIDLAADALYRDVADEAAA